MNSWCSVRPFSGAQSIRSLHNTVARLTALRKQLHVSSEPSDPRLTRFEDFGSNPGALAARAYVPDALPEGAPLVVVLHGCTQTAGGYDRGSGWSSAADEYGFALLFPEQQRANNPNLCFNWFAPEDARRGGGEALSIRQMVAAVQARHGTDPDRVFVTGLSAGGAMTAVMLATYPDVFAGGAVIAGLPFGAARSVPEALDRMRGQGLPAPKALAQMVRSASAHTGPWPTLSVWHGTADTIVHPDNSKAILDQWRALHDVPDAASRSDSVEGYPHRVWRDPRGRDVIEEYSITGMGHGTPLNVSGPFAGETAGAYMLDAGISSTRHIARFWGLADPASMAAGERSRVSAGETPRSTMREANVEQQRQRSAPGGVQKTIEDALRAAGLLRP